MEDFIGQFDNNVNAQTCKGLINLFNDAHKRKLTHQGLTGKVVDKQRKDSVDLSSSRITEKLHKKYAGAIDDFFESLIKAQHAYIEKFPILTPPRTYPLGVYEFNIQRYYPGKQAYHAWHYENTVPAVADRVLTWMSYLSTVPKGGETEFMYQQTNSSSPAGSASPLPRTSPRRAER